MGIVANGLVALAQNSSHMGKGEAPRRNITCFVC
jgi:hypothetical protein